VVAAVLLLLMLKLVLNAWRIAHSISYGVVHNVWDVIGGNRWILAPLLLVVVVVVSAASASASAATPFICLIIM